MEKVSSRIRQILRASFADPFSQEFDLKKLSEAFGSELNNCENDLLDFLRVCNELSGKIKQHIFDSFIKLNLSPDELRELFFIKTNKHYLDFTPQLIAQLDFKIPHEPEKTSYSKFTDPRGQQVNAQFVVEIIPDILAELIKFSFEWKPDKSQYEQLSNVNVQDVDRCFFALWAYANIYLNLRNAAYQTIIYEDGIVNRRKYSELKIETDLNTITLLRHAGLIRSNNNIQQFFFPLLRLYKDLHKNKVGVGYELRKNQVLFSESVTDPVAKARGDSSLMVFYPHFRDLKLDYFGGVTLQTLSDLFALIEECFEKLHRDNVREYSEKYFENIPIKFDEKDLQQFLIKASGQSLETVEKFISALVADEQDPYFWGTPLFRKDKFLLFSMPALIAPNYCLYFDRWASLAGFDRESKEKLFVDFALNDLKGSQPLYNVKVSKAETLDTKSEKFQNSLLIETNNINILLEVKWFDFPIESIDFETTLQLLGEATLDLEIKKKELPGYIKNEKEIQCIILTNYMTFSGLNVNNIPVADIILFKNYISVGNFRRALVAFQDGKPTTSDGGVIQYYRNEIEFNDNFKTFFSDPVPVRYILNRLYLKEQQITHDIVTPTIFVDTVDHVTDEELMKSRMGGLSGILNYEYYQEPDESVRELLDQSIIFSLNEIFSKLAYSQYESYGERISLYHKVSKTKLLGFSHLSLFILQTLQKLNGKPVRKDKTFEAVKYETDEVIQILEKQKKKFPEQLRISEFTIDEGHFTEEEEKKIISFSIDTLGGISPKNIDVEILESLFIPLGLLCGLSKKYDLEEEIYTACGNIVDGLNYLHKYQAARDFCEEILLLAIKHERPYNGWNILFKCYTAQKIEFDAAINGCLFLSSLSVLPEIPHFIATETIYGSLKFFRNFGFNEFAKYAHDQLPNFDLSEYDKQKITLAYFNTFFWGPIQKDVEVLNQVCDYVDSKLPEIIKYREHGVMPWLAFFYNIEKLISTKRIVFIRDISKYISELERTIDNKTVEDLKAKIIGDREKSKEIFITAILNTYETRSVDDFIHEAQHLNLLASNLLQVSLTTDDIDGILLCGLIFNDQSLTFEETFIESGSLLPFSKPLNDELSLRLNNYKYYLLSKINLEEKKLLIWLFEDLEKVYMLSIDNKKLITISELKRWDVQAMKRWIGNISSFYFNAKKDEDGNPICKFSNPRGESDYNEIVQKEDYQNLREALSFTNIEINSDIEELYFCTSIDLSAFPHNLIQMNNDFVAASIPVCNVISLERLADNHNFEYVPKSYSVSAWIPTEDQEPTICWGYARLESILQGLNATVHTTTYPEKIIKSDINIFLAHGVTDESGFKAIYTNHNEKKGIVFPHQVFGEGTIAVLFVCNSGSAKEALYSNSVVSFSSELLKSGYKAVIAPFWPFDVTMSKPWLECFLNVFNQGHSISESVWLANKKLTQYDAETSSMFYAPTGCFAMHLYGNPNIFVASET